MKDITFCLITCGEETEAECLAALTPFRDSIVLQEVRSVCPQIKALNTMLEQVETPYLVELNSDMVLFADAYERIRRAIDKYSHDPQWHSILFPLWDTLTEKQILALKILRTEIVKRFPFHESATPDIGHFKELTDAGYTCITNYLQKNPIGQHIVRGKKFCYNKYRDVYLTYRSHGWEWDSGAFMGGDDIVQKSKNHFDFFLYKYLTTDNKDYLYCIAGMIDGITAPLEHKSKDLSKKDKIPARLAIDRYLKWYQQQKTPLVTIF